MSIEWAMFRGMFRLLILSLLEKSMMRGYQILKAIRTLTGRKPSMSTIHDILSELECKKLIKSITTQTSEKYYQITDIGRKALSQVRARCRARVIDILNLIFEVQNNKVKLNR